MSLVLGLSFSPLPLSLFFSPSVAPALFRSGCRCRSFSLRLPLSLCFPSLLLAHLRLHFMKTYFSLYHMLMYATQFIHIHLAIFTSNCLSHTTWIHFQICCCCSLNVKSDEDNDCSSLLTNFKGLINLEIIAIWVLIIINFRGNQSHWNISISSRFHSKQVESIDYNLWGLFQQSHRAFAFTWHIKCGLTPDSAHFKDTFKEWIRFSV